MTAFFREPAGLLQVTGSDAIDFLHRMSTKDLRKLAQPGCAVPTLFTTAKGKLIDWALVMAGESVVWLKTSHPSRAAPLKAWLDDFIIVEDVEITLPSASYDCLTVDVGEGVLPCGVVPEVAMGAWVLDGQSVCTRDLACFGHAVMLMEPLAQADDRATRLGASGFRAGTPMQWEWRRVRAGVPSPHFEFAQQVNPLELRLTQLAVSWNKGCYIGQEVISRLDSYDKVARVLMGVELPAPIEGAEGKLWRDGRPIGNLTSAATLEGQSSALALVKRTEAVAQTVQLHLPGGEEMEVELADRPFWGSPS